MDEDQQILNPSGEITETPDGSQPESITSGDSEPVNPQGAENFSSEEAIWNSLSGPAKDRFRKMAQMANEYKSRYETEVTTRPSNFNQVPVPPVNPAAPEVTEAVKKLSEFGLATKEEVERLLNERIGQSVGSFAYQYELDKLEQRYNGSDGMPAFTREEYENFVSAHPQYRNYQPEDVYEKMFRDELDEIRLKNRGSQQPAKQSPSLRPTKTQVREEQWTPEAIEAKLQSMPESERVAWVDKNKGLIDTVLQRTTAE